MSASPEDRFADRLDHLIRATEANTRAQNASALAIGEIRAQFATWRETRCEDHHNRIGQAEVDRVEIRQLIEDLRSEMNRAIGKAAGAVGVAAFFATILADKIVR